MRIYVAGSWLEKPRIQEIMRELRDAGHGITFDWTENHDKQRSLCGIDAEMDMDGVRRCQAFVGVFEEDHKYQGALLEMGAALVQNKPVFLLGHAIDSCIFTYMWNVRQYVTLAELIAALEVYEYRTQPV